MKQRYWEMYGDFVKSNHYFQIYNKKATLIERILSIGIAIISSASVASWADMAAVDDCMGCYYRISKYFIYNKTTFAL